MILNLRTMLQTHTLTHIDGEPVTHARIDATHMRVASLEAYPEEPDFPPLTWLQWLALDKPVSHMPREGDFWIDAPADEGGYYELRLEPRPDPLTLQRELEAATGIRYSVGGANDKPGDPNTYSYTSRGFTFTNWCPDLVAFAGPCVVVGKRWVERRHTFEECYRSTKLVNPTWADLMHVAQAQRRVTKDRHHMFLENIDVLGPGTWGPKREPVTLIALVLGS